MASERDTARTFLTGADERVHRACLIALEYLQQAGFHAEPWSRLSQGMKGHHSGVRVLAQIGDARFEWQQRTGPHGTRSRSWQEADRQRLGAEGVYPAFHSWTPAADGRQLYLVSSDDDGTGREVLLFALQVIDPPHFNSEIEQCLRASAEGLLVRIEAALLRAQGETPDAPAPDRPRAA